jgi:hypothetical protein
MEFMDIVTAVFIGAIIGIGIVGLYIYVLYQRLKKEIDRLVGEVVQEAEASMVGVDIELDKGVYFCYNNKDKQFICQGATVQEIKEGFHLRFPDKTAYLAGGDPEVVEHFKTELLKLAQNENSTSQ